MLNKTNSPEHHLPALTGIRFFAIFHIFLHHLWAVYYYVSGTKDETKGLLAGMKDAPEGLMIFMSNGWVSTSLFFMLSGFILAYLYWGENGQLTMSRKHFWGARFARLYPIHLLVLTILIFLKQDTYIEEGQTSAFLVISAIATAGLLQAWIPSFIPMWSWPTWTISVLVFLYLLMPYLMSGLHRISASKQRLLLYLMPLISLIPAIGYTLVIAAEVPWSMNIELFFSNFPVFWIPYFVAGMLLARVFSLSRNSVTKEASSVFALGDLAFLVIVAITLIPLTEQRLIYAIRFGLLMPLFMMLILDLARGKGLIAKLLSLPGTRFLGEIGFSIFIWQAFVLTAAVISLSLFPEISNYQVTLSILMVLTLATVSTYYIEKPLTKWLKRKLD